MVSYGSLVAVPALIISLTACGTDDQSGATTFAVTLTNVSAPGDLPLGDGEATDVVLAPGVWGIFEAGGTLFTTGEAASTGLTHLAEDGNNLTLVVAADDFPLVDGVGTFGQVDEGVSYEENPIGPGVAVTFEVLAGPGQVLSFATMFAQSNDIFVAPAEGSIPLFDAAGLPRSGELTDEFSYFDAGTEVNEEPGSGPNQAPRQSEAGAGEDEGGAVTPFLGTDAAGFTYPSIAAAIAVTIAAVE